MKNLYLLWLLVIAFFFPKIANATAFDGFYAGVALGINSNSADLEINAFSPTIFISTLISEATADQKTVCGEIFSGWGKNFAWLYLGTRLGLNISTFHLKTSAYQNTSQDVAVSPLTEITAFNKLEMNHAEFTFDLKPGYFLQANLLFFGLIGGALNQARMTGETIVHGALLPIDFTETLKISKNKTVVGLRMGLGLEALLTSDVSLQLSYANTWYPQVKSSDSISFIVDQDPESIFSEFVAKPRKQTFTIGLAHYF